MLPLIAFGVLAPLFALVFSLLARLHANTRAGNHQTQEVTRA
jgi:hypothetical protein